MLAVWYERNGAAAEVLQSGELETPTPAPGEVRVRLAASGVNPIDVKRRRGARGQVITDPLVVPGFDGAGVIDAVGDGVAASRIGERVWVYEGQWQRPRGTAAEFVTVPAERAVALPDATSFVEGACLGIPALTAYHAVAVNGGVRGKSVLVTGGAGAVGHYAIQFAKLGGAKRVIATVSNRAKGEIATAAGADAVVNYKSEDVGQRCQALTDGHGVDRIIEVDLAANIQPDLAALRADSEIVVYGTGAPEIAVPFFPSVLKNVRYQFFIVYNLNAADRATALTEVSRLLKENKLRHQIAKRLPLAQTAEAHQLVESGQAVGNVVLDIA